MKWGPLERGDVLDRDRLDAVLQNYKPSAVHHFAAYAYVGESVTAAAKYYRNNVGGALTLLEAMRDHGVTQMVFSSSCTTYGTPQSMPIGEDHPQNPINPYGASKLMVERMLADFGAAYNLRSVSLRYFNAAGADPRWRNWRGSRSRDPSYPACFESCRRRMSATSRSMARITTHLMERAFATMCMSPISRRHMSWRSGR